MNSDNQQLNYQQVTYPTSVSSNDMTGGQPSADEKVPSVWPGARGIYRYSKNVVRPYWKPILGLIAVSYLVTIVFDRLAQALNIGQGYGQILSTIVSLVFTIALSYVYRDSIEGRPTSFVGALKQVDGSTFIKLFLNSIVFSFLVGLSLLIFIIPVFFVFPRLALSQYYVIYEKRGPIEAIKLSWNSMKGNVGKFWGLVGLTIAIALLFITIIGIPVAIYLLFMYSAASVILFFYIRRRQAGTVADATAPNDIQSLQ